MAQGTADQVAVILDTLGIDAARLPVVKEFADALSRRSSKRPGPSQSPTKLGPKLRAKAILDSFNFVEARPSGSISLRIHNPQCLVDGGPPRASVIEIACPDRQFLVTTVVEELRRLGHSTVRTLHPVFGCERSDDGTIAQILPARKSTERESFLQVELADQIPADQIDTIENAIRSVVQDVDVVTRDYGAMRYEVTRVANEVHTTPGSFSQDESAEASDLLEWLIDGNFVLQGTCQFTLSKSMALVPDSALGILTEAKFAPESFVDKSWQQTDSPIRIARSAVASTVHRQVLLHTVTAIHSVSADTLGMFLMVGVFTRKGNNEPSATTPVLRHKLAKVLELEDVVARSHDETALISLFQVLPKDEIFQADVQSLRNLMVELLAAEQENDVRVLMRAEPQSNTVSTLLAVPRDLYTPALRARLERFLLTQLDGTTAEVSVELSDRSEALVRFVIHVDGSVPEDPLDPLAREVRLLCRTWEQELNSALLDFVDAETAPVLAHAYGPLFPTSYRETYNPGFAAADILVFERMKRADDGVAIEFSQDLSPTGHNRLKVYSLGEPLELSRFLPILESLGLWVVDEVAYSLSGDTGGAVAAVGDSRGGSRGGTGSEQRLRADMHLQDFGVYDPTGASIDVRNDGDRIATAALALNKGRSEIDSLNRLVLRAGMTWQDVSVLRAYRRYRNLVGSTYSLEYVNDCLVENAAASGAILNLFAARFDPQDLSSPEDRQHLHDLVVRECDAVARLDQDRILRSFLALVEATTRTNRYLPHKGDYLAFKFDSSAVPGMPRPVPFREIFVHAPYMEGIHLRWGPVARGGIRWSERYDDYRTEILELMRAQVLKNAVIIPTGAKGGFVLKNTPPAPELPAYVEQAYRTFIEGLLDLTDNVVNNKILPVEPRYDGDDPYMVVAADRGTAALSDLANELSESHHFWLDDAFASGGSQGYDHKALGITARGAWVAISRHFSELDIDITHEPFTVVGIGDMSGDVFGNGMLHSQQIRLVAAFDHRDIFVDPDPDPSTSFAERERLFGLPQSSWQDYNAGLISEGGGVWSRALKQIKLTDQVRAALRITDHALTPSELIQAILRAPVDLLFAGGIGTFVRADREADDTIDDRTNADVRVTASDVRARVVGEGANLACTQWARIDYARRGGRINTDAVDNAAGVDISDHEVNIKILLDAAVQHKDITGDERNDLLQKVCDDVVATVLNDTALQTWALSREAALSPTYIDSYEELITRLEGRGVIDRVVECLPTREEMQARKRAEAGLTRPELAVLLAGAKRSLTAEILASSLPDQSAMQAILAAYFPPLLVEQFGRFLDDHRLRRELIASGAANEIVNRMGITFVTRVGSETGVDHARIAAAYWIARGVTDAASIWKDVTDPAVSHDPRQQLELAAGVSALLEALSRDYLRRNEVEDIETIIERDRTTFSELQGSIAELGSPIKRRLRQRLCDALIDQGLPPTLALEFVCLPELEIAPDVAVLSRDLGRSVPEIADSMLHISELLHIDKLNEYLTKFQPDDSWAHAARLSLLDELDSLRRIAAKRALRAFPSLAALDAVDRFVSERASAISRISDLMHDAQTNSQLRLDAITVIARAIRVAID